MGEEQLTAPRVCSQPEERAPTRRMGSSELCPLLADAMTSGYLLPLSELWFPHLENGEINTCSQTTALLMGPRGAYESQGAMPKLIIPAPGTAPSTK